MKNKVTFAQVLASVRKSSVRPSVVITPKVRKMKDNRNSWKKDLD